ncbi:Peptidoglycan-associated lipoprotein [Dyadobacter sp. CECT 9275]|uniref:Peptidoglycan-associated lipoprotein n=1 Tax=Dyadobacter helix TaxID=2822344 RepID=A0A916NBN7_9BACT|nr:OmpA family protein [Dyadobacter sp. CECT 9275]CAG4995484.1 Peptidoglycan-associated lipoprotein [Dyadobacter sp. CECT 9275]
MYRQFASLILLFWLSICSLQGQDLPSSRKARDLYEKAQKAWQARQLHEAASLYEKVLETDPGHYESNLRMAQISELQRNADLSKKYFQRLIVIRPADPQSAAGYQWLGRAHFQAERYDSAQYYFEKALPLFPPKSSLNRLTEKLIASCKFAKEAVKTPLDIKKYSLGDTVNFLSSQYFPVLTADNETLIFTGLTSERDENIYITHRIEKHWDVPEQISKTINSANNEGTCSISADGRTLVFTACNREDGYGSCDLYITRKEGNDWSTPVNMGGVINSRDWESQPSLSADGQVLYFASDRRGGYGKKDIWVARVNATGEWDEPKNAGMAINSPEEEVAPFIHANNRTLFFSSNGFPGMGGFDLFISRLSDTTWAAPVNIGYPINTVTDQVGMFIASDGIRAYYTDESTRNGKPMLFTFELPRKLREMIIPTRYAKGKIIDKKTSEPVTGHIDLFDLQTQNKVGTYQADPKTGSFLAVLNQGSDYAFYVSAEGYLFKSLSFSVRDSASTVNLEIPLESIEKNRVEVLHNIFFRTGSYELDEKSKVELNRLAGFLSENKTVRIEIAGHTDDVGADAANLELSRQRAISVTNFLKNSGISPDRLLAKGYGKTVPAVPNNSEENRQKNRRIEWRIL